MAWVSRPYVLSVTFRDNNGKEATAEVYLGQTTIPGDAILAASAIRNAMANLSDAVPIRYSISRVWEETEPATPPATSEVERKLTSIFRAENGQAVRVSIPSPLFTLELPGTNVVDYANASFVDFRNLIIDGLLGLGVAPAVSNADSNISRFERAYIVHRYRKP